MQYKILFIAPTPYFSDRGCHVRILEEANALQRRGNKVTIITYHLGRNIKGIKTIRTLNIPWYKKKEAGPSYHKIYLDILLTFKGIYLMRREKFDIIHAHLHEGVFVGFNIKTLMRLFGKRIPLVADIQGSLVREMSDHGYLKNKIAKRIFYMIESMILKMPDMIFTSSTNATEYIKKEFSPGKKVIPVCDAVDTNLFKPCSKVKRIAVRKKLFGKNIKEDDIVIAYLGLLNSYQGVDLLIKAAEVVLKKKKDVKFLVMGFPDVEKYKGMAEELGISNSIIFTGKVPYEKAPEMLCAADMAVSFKISETEANGKLYNYIACGLPCTVSDIPVNREILEDCGIYAKKNDIKDSAARILWMIDNPSQIKEMSKKSRNLSKGYSWSKRIIAVLNKYKELI